MTKARLYWLVATGLIAAQALVAWAHGFNFNERGLAAGVFVGTWLNSRTHPTSRFFCLLSLGISFQTLNGARCKKPTPA